MNQRDFSPSPLVGEGRGGGSAEKAQSRHSSPDPSPAYSEGSATQKSHPSWQQPTWIGGGEQNAEALWYVGPGRAEIRVETLPAGGPDEVELRALYGGISRGTERLVFAGR